MTCHQSKWEWFDWKLDAKKHLAKTMQTLTQIGDSLGDVLWRLTREYYTAGDVTLGAAEDDLLDRDLHETAVRVRERKSFPSNN